MLIFGTSKIFNGQVFLFGVFEFNSKEGCYQAVLSENALPTSHSLNKIHLLQPPSVDSDKLSLHQESGQLDRHPINQPTNQTFIQPISN